VTESWSWKQNKRTTSLNSEQTVLPCGRKKTVSLKAASEKIYTNLVEISKMIEEGENTDKSSYFLASGLGSVWMLSAGFAVESLTKALLIKTIPSSVNIIKEENGEKTLNIGEAFGGKKFSHDLNFLTKKVSPKYRPKFTDEETLFMFKMTSYTTWRGKYPIPLDAPHLTYSGQGIGEPLIEKIMDHSERYNRPLAKVS